VAVLERAVRERPDVAAAVLEQMHYGVVDPITEAAKPLAGPADGRPADTRRIDHRAAGDDGAPERVGGDRR
jgi:hypothetical protein